MLYCKPAGMSYTDLAIWIDQHSDVQCDKNLFFNYIYSICEMLTRKKGYFPYEDEREDFSIYLSSIVYDRYINSDDPPKSVLNYVKGIIGYKKIDYTREQWQQNITPAVLPESSLHYNYEFDDRLVFPSISLLKTEFHTYITQMGNTIKRIVEEYEFSSPIQEKAVLISAYLSFLNMIVLPVKDLERISCIRRSQNIKEKSIYKLHEEQINRDYIIVYHNADREKVEEVVSRIISFIRDEMSQMVGEQYSICSYAPDIKQDFVAFLKDEDDEEDLPESVYS